MGTNAVRHEWVDAAKGISILLVVMVHTASWLSFAGVEPGAVLQVVNGSAATVRMPMFFLAAGLFAGKWIAASWRKLVNGKLALLVWVFVLWQVAMFAYKYIGGMVLPDQQDSSLAAHLLRVVVAPVRPNAELWFLWALVVYFVAAKLTSRWDRRVLLAAAAVLSLLWSIVVIPALGDEGQRLLGPGLSTVPMYFVFFLAGSVYKDGILRSAAALKWWGAALILAAWITLVPVLDVGDLIEFPGEKFVGQVFGVCAGVAAAKLLRHVRPVTYLGSRTLPVYLSHTTFVVAIACAIYLLGVDFTGLWFAPLVPWLVGIVAVALGLLLYRLAADTFLFRQPAWFQLGRKGDPQSAQRSQAATSAS